ncbi:hypothetical protein BN1843_28150 [Escherichia coli]|nr:hypothetical protein BN1843_28150 [Escherichia coli]
MFEYNIKKYSKKYSKSIKNGIGLVVYLMLLRRLKDTKE